MVQLTCTRINLLLALVLLPLCIVQAEGNKNNQTWLIGLHPNATNGTTVPWVRRVRLQQAPGCGDRPWICNDGGFPSQVRRRCCGNRCVEVTSDVNNCGVCGIRCPFTWQCCRGVCIDTNVNPFNCGRCFNRCPIFTFCTYGMCGYAGPSPPFPFPPKPPKPPIPFPPKPPKPPIPFPPKPPKPPFPFPPKPPKPPKGPEAPEPPQSRPFPELGQPPINDGPPPPEPPVSGGQATEGHGGQPPPQGGQRVGH
ncbi:stigma-specific STIG1-like protein 4 [Cynara cardunculus var. scolymus]|uniref:Stigma-specific protein Stig1 n=1 Tax=Cynara cardunculus var. scolymus TaxID=59895 RepID=A0A103Y1F6_CYNCS|nr:stigma-specific STIG1-like protein 4 [Cynara cardunculus var. scolymus]KVI00769.1 Stigma-specific protein Stig1 [Cynara cardunculus var. scolymus]